MSAFGLKWGIPLLVGLALLVGGGAWVWNNKQDKDQRAHDDALLCEGINANRASIRNLLVSARKQTPHLTRRARRFYHEQIGAITPLDCGNFNRDSLNALSGGGGAPPGQTKQPP